MNHILKNALLGASSLIVATGIAMAQDPAQPGGGAGTAPLMLPGQGQAGTQMQGGAGMQGGPGMQGGAGARMQGEAGAEAGGAAAGAQMQGEAGAEAGAAAGTSGEGARTGTAETQTEGEAGEGAQSGTAQTQTGGDSAGAAAQAGAQSNTTVNLTAENETTIRQFFSTQPVDVDPVDVDIRVSVGVTVPPPVTLHPLPVAIVSTLPPGCDYVYFVWHDDVVVVCRETRVVALIVVDVVG